MHVLSPAQFFETSAKANTNVDETFQVGVVALAGSKQAADAGLRTVHGAQKGGKGCTGVAAACLPALPHAAHTLHSPLYPCCPAQSVARDIMVRLKDSAPDASSSGGSGPSLRVGAGQRKAAASSKSGCC